jgi:hypothetical protein
MPTCDIKPHELDAVRNLMLCSRALAQIIDSDPQYAAKLRAWAATVERMLERIDVAVSQDQCPR